MSRANTHDGVSSGSVESAFGELGEVLSTPGCCDRGQMAAEIVSRLRAAVELDRRRFDAIQEASPDGFLLLKPVYAPDAVTICDFVVTYANPVAGRMMKRAPDTLIGARILETFPAIDSDGLFARYVERYERGAPETVEVACAEPWLDGWYRITAARVGEELALSFTDITDRRRTDERLRILSRATEALVSLDQGRILNDVAALTVPALADWCAIDLIGEDGTVCRAGVAIPDPSLREIAETWWSRFPPGGEAHWLRELVRSRRGTGIVILDDAMVDANGPEEAATIRQIGVREAIVVPVGTRERSFGALTMIMSRSGRSFDPVDVDICTELGIRIGFALENALLFKAEREAREQVSRLLDSERRAKEDLALLARAGVVLSTSIDYEQTLKAVVAVALPGLGDFGFFDIIEEDGVRRVPSAFQDEESLEVLRHTTWDSYARIERNICALSHDGEAGLEPRIDEAWILEVHAPPELSGLLRALHVCSLITVPLRSAGVLIGALTLCFGKSGRHHSPQDLHLAQELAQRAALSVAKARLFRQAQESARRAEEAGRIKDEFLGTVSHELRTPLNAILGWSTMLLKTSEGRSTKMRKGLEVIHRNAQAQARIVEDILEVSRIITGKLQVEPKPVDLVAIAKQAMEAVRSMATAKGVALELKTAEPATILIADPDRILQVVWNLVSNGVKFTPGGGAVTVRVAREGPEVTLLVKDTGEGIDPAFLPHVFERFRQGDSSTTRQHGGVGLGLAIVRHIVELHGGHVAADSEGPGRGATFTVRLPVRAMVPVATHIPGGASDGASSTGHLDGVSVVVVDDDPDARELVEYALEHAGAHVEVAGSAKEGLDAIVRERPDILVSDLGMPGVDGYELIQNVRALSAERGGLVPAIALTAYTRQEDQRRAVAAGYTTHMSKPIAAPELIDAIASLVTRQRAAHPR